MSTDPKRQLERAALGPRVPVDVGAIARRGRRLQLQRFVATGSAVALMLGGVAFAAINWNGGSQQGTPVVGPNMDDATRYYVYAVEPDVQSQAGYISFEVEGAIDVDAGDDTVCVEGHFKHMVAAHIVDATPEHGVVLTLFEQPGEPLGAEPFSRCQSIDSDGNLIQRLIEEPESFRVDFHHPPENSPELESPLLSEPKDICSGGVPIVEAQPEEAAIGQRVEITGRCMFDEVRGTTDTVGLSAMTDHDGDVLPPDGTPQDGLPPCDFLAGESGRVRIDEEGNLTGFLVVPSEGVCFQEDSDDKIPVRPGYTYWINVGCHTCRYGTFPVIESDGEEAPASGGLSMQPAVVASGQDVTITFNAPDNYTWGVDGELWQMDGEERRIAYTYGWAGRPEMRTIWPSGNGFFEDIGFSGSASWNWTVPKRLEPGTYELRKDAISDETGSIEDRTKVWTARFEVR